MVDPNLFNSIKKPLVDARSLFIFLPPNPSLDKVAASLAFSLSLDQAKKKVSVLCPSPMRVEYSDLIGIDLVKKEMVGKNLTVSFDYVEDSIEKVSYNIENNKFNLVIQPKAGFKPLSAEKVKFEYTGGEADLVMLVGVNDLSPLTDYQKNAELLFQKDKLVNLSVGQSGGTQAAYNLFFPEAASFSEIMTLLISRLSLPVDADIATNLLSGIEKATKMFTVPETGVASFEAAALCLRSGARHRGIKPMPEQSEQKPAPAMQPMPAQVSARQAPPPTDDEDQKPKPDWLEPKIYRGDTRV